MSGGAGRRWAGLTCGVKSQASGLPGQGCFRLECFDDGAAGDVETHVEVSERAV